MSLLRSRQTVLDVQQGLCALAIQNSPPFVGFRNCLAYSSLADIFCWILIVRLTSESPTLHMHRVVLIQTQGDPYAYFWISFWAHFPLLRCCALQFKWRRPPQMLIYFLNSVKLKNFTWVPPPYFTFQRMPPGWKLIMRLTSFVYLLSWSIIPYCAMSLKRSIMYTGQFF